MIEWRVRGLIEIMNSYIKRFIKLIFGIILYAFGVYLTVQANVGLAPWEAFHVGLSQKTGISFGKIVVLVGIIILILTVSLKEKFGFGTIVNVTFIGYFCDLFFAMNLVPLISNYWLGIGVMLLGLFVISFASYFYIGSGFGAGPRDSMMIAIRKRFPDIPVGVIRGVIEGTVLLLGWLMGAKVGFGTVMAVFGISFILQFTFKMLNFDVRTVESESVMDTIHNLKLLKQHS